MLIQFGLGFEKLINEIYKFRKRG